MATEAEINAALGVIRGFCDWGVTSLSKERLRATLDAAAAVRGNGALREELAEEKERSKRLEQRVVEFQKSRDAALKQVEALKKEIGDGGDAWAENDTLREALEYIIGHSVAITNEAHAACKDKERGRFDGVCPPGLDDPE